MTHSSGVTIVARIIGSRTSATLICELGSGKSAGLSIVFSVPSLKTTVNDAMLVRELLQDALRTHA